MALSNTRRRLIVGAIVGAATVLFASEVFLLSPAARRAATGPFEVVGADGLLADLLEDRDMEVRVAASDALLRRGPRALASLSDRLGSGDPARRRAAAAMLGAVGPPARAATPALRRLLASDPDDSVREAAAVAAGQVATGDPAATGDLLALLDVGSAAERIGAARAAPRLAEADWAAAAARLARLLAHADPLVREEAAEGLGRLRHHARPAAEALIAALDDPDPKVREEVKEAVERLAHAPDLNDPRLARRLTDGLAHANRRPAPPAP